MEREGYQLPFALTQSGSEKVSVIQVIEKFSEEIKLEEANYKKVWDAHLVLHDGETKKSRSAN